MNVSQIEQMQLKLRDIPDGMLYTEYNLQNEACKKMLREPSCLKKNEKRQRR